ncbi:MAG TPA: hypothetical protein PLR06_04680 [Cyclobacteriaceae bacterium]|nr:hypothetical protein [Cyclobacteriaceae bacterium]
MKTWKAVLAAVFALSLPVFLSFTLTKEAKHKHYRTTYRSIPKGCVFSTLMGEEFSADPEAEMLAPENVVSSIHQGLAWIMKAQNRNGGWGAGSHNRQDVMDPHAVPADPATTAMVAMAILRSNSTLTTGENARALYNALQYLLNVVEKSPAQNLNIGDQTGTQIQVKLGGNIDVVLASQFFSNLLDGHLDHDSQLKARVKKANDICVGKIQKAQEDNGSFASSGWAGVLQSSFATNALEAAQANGTKVDDRVLSKAREFQKNNYNSKTGDVKTELGAGVMLYSVTGSARASAKEARKVEEAIQNAIEHGRLAPNAAPSAQNLEKIGFGKDEAIKYSTAYEVYQSAKVKAQNEDVMDGFGSNGGEEFMSYLQTGESMIIGKDNAWKKWYDNMGARLLNIQNDDGSWSGHHCITSPVFCTASCLLILSVNNDVERLEKQGAN